MPPTRHSPFAAITFASENPLNDLLLGVIWYAVFIFSLTLHEAAHALFAMRGGDLTAYHSGQVSLDPTPHLRRVEIALYIGKGSEFHVC